MDQDTGTPASSDESSVSTETTAETTPNQPSQTESSSESTAIQSTDSTKTQVQAEPKATVRDAVKAFTDFSQKAKDGGFERLAPTKPVQPQPQHPNSRDYSGLPEDKIPLFKNMSNAAFAELKPLFLEHAKLKEENTKLKSDFDVASKSSFFENEQAYQVTPEYKQYTANISQLDAEMNHWQEQLANIREGKPWAPLVYDPQGNVVVGQERPATIRDEASIVNAMTKGHILKQDISNKLSALQNSFMTGHKSFTAKFQETVDKVFEGADKEVLDKAMQSKLSLFPSYTHGNPLVKGLATAIAVIEGMGILLEEAKASATTEKLKTRTMTSAGPSNGSMGTGASKGEKVDDIMKEFERAKALGVA